MFRKFFEWLEKIGNRMERQFRDDDVQQYLHQATDHADLERRLREVIYKRGFY